MEQQQFIAVTGEGTDHVLSTSSNWDYEADLDLLKVRLKNSSSNNERKVEEVRKLLAACISLTRTLEPEGFDACVMLDKNAVASTSENDALEAMSTAADRGTPLDIHLILNHVMSYLQVNSLLTCRLINREWNSNAVHWIQELQRTRYDGIHVESEDFSKFSDDLQNAGVHPFTNLTVNLDGLSLDLCERFFPKHGHSIQKLTIQESDDDDKEDRTRPDEEIQENVKKLLTILQHVPNLNYLSLSYILHIPDFVSEDFSTNIILPQVESIELWAWMISPLNQRFLGGLFAMLPSVETVLVDHISDAQDWEIFFKAMQNLNIDTFTCNSEMQNTGILKAMSKNYAPKLTELAIHVDGYCTNRGELFESLEELLKFQSGSLEILTLNLRSPQNREERVQFPVMKSLTSLTMDGSYKDITAIVPIQPRQIPKLYGLTIEPQALITHENPTLEHAFFKEVQELDFGLSQMLLGRCTSLPPLSNTDESYTTLWPIAARFPNLKRIKSLKTTLDDVAMKEIVQNLQHVEDLELKIFSNDLKNFNWTVSGVEDEGKSEWALSQIAEHVGLEAVLSWINPHGPSLRDLKCLKKLQLSFTSARVEARIDEFAVYLTFLRMSPEICIYFRGDFSISEDLAVKLTKHFRNIYFIPNPQNKIDPYQRGEYLKSPASTMQSEKT